MSSRGTNRLPFLPGHMIYATIALCLSKDHEESRNFLDVAPGDIMMVVGLTKAASNSTRTGKFRYYQVFHAPSRQFAWIYVDMKYPNHQVTRIDPWAPEL